MRASRKGRELVYKITGPRRIDGQKHMPAFNGRADSVHPGDLSALRIHRYAEHLFLQHVDDGAAVGLVFDQYRPGTRVQHSHLLDGRQGAAEVQVPVQTVPAVVVVIPFTPDLNGHIVVVLVPLERGIHTDDLGAKRRDLFRVVIFPPVPVDQVTALNPGAALV